MAFLIFTIIIKGGFLVGYPIEKSQPPENPHTPKIPGIKIGDPGYPRDLEIPIPGIQPFLGIFDWGFLEICWPRESQIPILGIEDFLVIFLRIFGDSKSPIPIPGATKAIFDYNL